MEIFLQPMTIAIELVALAITITAVAIVKPRFARRFFLVLSGDATTLCTIDHSIARGQYWEDTNRRRGTLWQAFAFAFDKPFGLPRQKAKRKFAALFPWYQTEPVKEGQHIRLKFDQSFSPTRYLEPDYILEVWLAGGRVELRVALLPGNPKQLVLQGWGRDLDGQQFSGEIKLQPNRPVTLAVLSLEGGSIEVSLPGQSPRLTFGSRSGSVQLRWVEK